MEVYANFFQDKDDDGAVISDGSHALTYKLKERNTYLNGPHKRPLKGASSTQHPKRLANCQVGCVN